MRITRAARRSDLPRLEKASASSLAVASLLAFSVWLAIWGGHGLPAFAGTGDLHPESRAAFRTAPSRADPLDITLQYLYRNEVRWGMDADDLGEWAVSDRYVTGHNGTTHLYLRQRFRGIEVFNAGVAAAVDSEGRLVTLHDRLVRRISRSVNTAEPAISAIEAITAAAEHLKLEIQTALQVLSNRGGPSREVRVSKGGISLDEITAKLMYLPRPQAEVRLVWNVVLRPEGGRHWWTMHLDAVTRAILWQNDWIANDSYNVYALPLHNPDEGTRTLEVDPADGTASPFGWHDTDGVNGPESTDTTGNNVLAQEDGDGDDVGGRSPDGGPALSFDFPIDFDQNPTTFESAAITNLFYLNNVLHDIHHQYGFDEASGNFQENNYGRGGISGDPVIADAQDGAELNNANFGTPPDGERPRMQVFFFVASVLMVNSPGMIAGEYFSGSAQFGPPLTPEGLSGDLIQALDPPDPNTFSTTDACSPLTNGAEVDGKIALIDRGDCFFVDKVRHAQDAGAIAAVVVNHLGDGLVIMGGDDLSITIPSLFIGRSDGDLLKAALAGGVNVTLSGHVRDTDFDNGVVIHEYGHGISNRLTGGSSNVDCLIQGQSRGMGEGWSDFWALALTAKPGEERTDPRTIGTYALGQPVDGQGFRRFPYSTDPALNPLTFADLASSSSVHDTGEVWALALWELYWDLVDLYGFDADFYTGSAGNNLALQLVMDGLKLQPCEPTFTDGRDAILQADLINHGAVNRCLIWEAFARRGIGVQADAGGPGSLFVTESFRVPGDCESEIPQDNDQQKCINALNKGLRKVVKAQGKLNLSCIKDGADGRLTGTIDNCLTSDAKGRVDKAGRKTASAEGRSCGLAPNFGPSSAAAVNDAAIQTEITLIHDLFGLSLEATIVPKLLARDASKCQQAIAKSTAKCRDAQLKAFNRCKKTGIANDSIQRTLDLESCMGADPRGKVARACDPATGRIAARTLPSKCAASSIDLSQIFPGCGTDDPGELAECLEEIVSCHVCTALNQSDSLLVDCDLFDDGQLNVSCAGNP